MALHPPPNGPPMEGPPPPRHMQFMFPPDYKIFLMNKRLQERIDDCDNHWWDAFVSEFFDDKATYTISFYLDGQKHYTLGRVLIPRFFRTMFESGVIDMNIITRLTKEFTNTSNNSIVMDCEHTTMVMHHAKPIHTKVCAEGHLVVEFNADDLMLIRSWHFSIRSHLEYIPKQVPLQNLQHPAMLEEMCKNVTRQGFTPQLHNYLKLCFILEPMKELMSRHKTYQMDPHECLKNCLFQKWQRITASSDSSRTNKRTSQRRRKNSSNTSGQANSKKKGFPTSDVMMVGEPTLMESFGEDDERTITRHENDQFSNSTHVKSEENDGNTNFSTMSSPAPAQWQQPNSNQINSGAVKSEPTEVANNATSPLATSA